MKTRRGNASTLWTRAAVVVCIFVSFASVKANQHIYYGQILENAPSGSMVRGILLPFGEKCQESDWTENPGTALHGTDVSDFSLVYHHGKGFSLVTTKTLDREQKPRYFLSALVPGCFDSPLKLEVEVLDWNDNKPYFRSKFEGIEVSELTRIGSELTRILAFDVDTGRNGKIRYYVFPHNKYIHVIPKTGQVMLVNSLKNVKNITTRIYARDQGDASLESEPLVLHIDVHRAVPSKVRKPRAVSEDLFYTVTVSEDVKIGDMVFTVPDQKFEKKWFEVMSEADAPVQIERDTGRLYLAQRLKSTAEVVVKIQNMRGKNTFYTNSWTSMTVYHFSINVVLQLPRVPVRAK